MSTAICNRLSKNTVGENQFQSLIFPTNVHTCTVMFQLTLLKIEMIHFYVIFNTVIVSKMHLFTFKLCIHFPFLGNFEFVTLILSLTVSKEGCKPNTLDAFLVRYCNTCVVVAHCIP